MSKTCALVVDDEVLIRLDLAERLEEAGYEVYEASNADEAISILEQHDQIRLVFTDVQMPGSMDGMHLAHYVRKRWPPTAIVICSANKKPDIKDLPTNTHWLGKPIDIDGMALALTTAQGWITP
jgi:CheY-like chemotaxis protein